MSSWMKNDLEHVVEEARLARLSEFDGFSSRRWGFRFISCFISSFLVSSLVSFLILLQSTKIRLYYCSTVGIWRFQQPQVKFRFFSCFMFRFRFVLFYVQVSFLFLLNVQVSFHFMFRFRFVSCSVNRNQIVLIIVFRFDLEPIRIPFRSKSIGKYNRVFRHTFLHFISYRLSIMYIKIIIINFIGNSNKYKENWKNTKYT